MFESGRGYLQAKTIRGKKPAATDEDALAALNSNKDVQGILSALPVKHASQKAHLRTLHREHFGHWHFLLRYGAPTPITVAYHLHGHDSQGSAADRASTCCSMAMGARPACSQSW